MSSAVKVAVTSDALYRVTAAQIAAGLGCAEAEVLTRLAAGQLVVHSQGRPVAAEYDATGISFFGRVQPTRYSGINVYWIEPGAGVRVSTGTVQAASEQAGQTARETAHFEQNATVQMPLFDNPAEDPWFWQRLMPGGTLQKTLTSNFILPGYSSAEQLTLALKGTGTNGGSSSVSLTLNGVALGTQTLYGRDRVAWTFGLSGASVGTNNQLKITLNSGADICVDWYDVAYQRKQIACNNEMLLTLNSTAPRTVTGFSSADIELFDVTGGGPWRRAEGGQITGGSGNYRVSFLPAATGQWLAVAGGVRRAPAAVTGRPALALKLTTNGADHLVITVPAFAAAADDLVAYRSAKGLVSRKIYAEDIFDEFNYGLPDPRAIRAFLGYAYRMWARVPRYVLMLGEGSVDFRNFKNFGDCLVPPMVSADEYGQFATDNVYGDVDGCNRLEITVGRVPVINAAEAAVAVNKIKLYEAGGAWKQQGLAVADNPDYAGNFTLDSEAILPRLGVLETSRAYLEQLSVTEARTEMVNDLNAGRGVTTYIGHANPQQLTFEGLFGSGDITTNLNNGARPGFFVALTCLVGSYGGVGQDLLAEQLVVSSNGAAAVWASASQVYSADNRQIGMALLSNVLVVGTARLGDSVLAAVSNAVSEGRIGTVRTYNLLGDPALASGDPEAERPGRSAGTGIPSYSEWIGWAVPPASADLGSGLDPQDDPDGDGQANEAERLAGTDPMDASSRLEIRSQARANGQVTMRWASAPQRTYRLEGAAEITGPYVSVSGSQSATPDENVLTVPMGQERIRFFRVVVE